LRAHYSEEFATEIQTYSYILKTTPYPILKPNSIRRLTSNGGVNSPLKINYQYLYISQ